MNPKTTRPSARAMKISAFVAISGFSEIAPIAADPTFEMAMPAPIAPKPKARAAARHTHATSWFPAATSSAAAERVGAFS